MGKCAAVVFSGDNPHWVAKYLHKEVNHCCLCVLDRGKWIVIEMNYFGVDAYILDDLPKGVYYQRVKIDRFKIFNVAKIGLSFPTCVSLVKTILGISNPFIQTPWQLLKHLRKKYGQQTEKAKADSTREGDGGTARSRAKPGNRKE